MAAGYACLKLLKKWRENVLLQETKQLASGFKHLADKHGIPMLVHQVGGMFGFFFADQETVTCYEDVTKCDVERYSFFHLMPVFTWHHQHSKQALRLLLTVQKRLMQH